MRTSPAFAVTLLIACGGGHPIEDYGDATTGTRISVAITGGMSGTNEGFDLVGYQVTYHARRDRETTALPYATVVQMIAALADARFLDLEVGRCTGFVDDGYKRRIAAVLHGARHELAAADGCNTPAADALAPLAAKLTALAGLDTWLAAHRP